MGLYGGWEAGKGAKGGGAGSGLERLLTASGLVNGAVGRHANTH